MKKIMAIILSVSLMTVLAVGCSKNQGSSSAVSLDPDAYAVKEPITIEWWHALEEQYTGTIDKVLAGFKEKYPDITVNAIYQGSYSDLNEKLIAAQAAGTTLPAVCVANTPYVAEYGASGVCEVLDDYISATGFDIDDFGKGLIASTQYDEEQISLPFLISTQVIYYNKTVADEEGITLPEKWDDMQSFMEKAAVVENGATTRYATVFPGWDQWYFETFYLNNGVSLINEDGASTDLDSDKAVEIANSFKSWCDDGYSYWAYGTDASSVMRQNFIDGKAFSVCHTSSLYNTYVDKCDFEVGMAYYPAGSEAGNSEVGGCVLMIPAKNSQEVKNAGWALLSYLCSKDVNMTWAEDTGYMPTRNSVLETEEGTSFLKEKPAFQCIFDNLDFINPRIQHAAYSSFASIWMQTMGKVIIEGGDMEQSMKEAAQEMNEILADA